MEERFKSLIEALEGWFERSLAELPAAARQRVEEEFFPFRWDLLSPDQRRVFAQQWDYKNDPATEAQRQAAWDLVARRGEVEAKIREWERVGAGTAGDLATKEARLAELREEITTIDLAEKRMSGKEGSEKVRRGDLPDESAATDEGFEYIAYPRAMRRLRERLGATPEEVAAWVFWGETHGGLVAYTNANELDPPPKFGFFYTMGDDYVSPLMACWFRRDDIEAFQPDERYITGKALIERWGKEPDIEPKAFVQAKIEESRLLDMHPNCGGTRATWPEQESFPPMESGLFALSHVQAIEADDFGADEGIEESAAGSCQPVSAALIRQNFRVIRDADKNEKWWKEKMADAKRYGLLGCRVGEGKKGRAGGSLWRPDMIAGWLVDRHTKEMEGLPAEAVHRGLRQFPGCEDIADDMFPPDEEQR